MRRKLIALAAGALSVACASAAPPPGGPEDLAPPQLLKVTPDSGALNVRDENAVFTFDETINDRGTGVSEIDAHFLVSPSDGLPRISWHRSRIDVRPRHGFRENTTYSIILLPGLSDLRSNLMKSGRTIVFSTGPSIPPHSIAGIVFDWAAERPAARAFVQATTPDSVRYLAQADSAGRFIVGPLPAGQYLVRAVIDANNNRDIDRNEAYDSLLVTVPRTEAVELLAIPRDTLFVRLLQVVVSDSVTLRITFDRPLSPGDTITPANFRLAGADSVSLGIVTVVTPAQEAAQLATRQQATADSLRLADSLAGKPLPPVRPVSPPTTARGATVPPPKPSVPAPITTLLLKLERALAPITTYRLVANDMRGLNRRTRPSERSFTTPRPPPPKPAADSSRAIAPPAARPAAPGRP